MIVRLARREDAAAIADILNPVIRETAITFNSVERTSADIVEAIENVPCYLVAEHENVVVGMASYDQFRKGIGYARAMEHTIVVGPRARGLGVGRALMEAIIEHARASGVGSLWAGVSGENPDGVAFHKACGFTYVVRLPSVGYKFGRWMDLDLLRFWLQEGDGRADSG